MTLVQFIRLFTRNLHLMLIVGALMGAIVWYLTKDEVRTYTSSALVHTGIFSGYNIESQGNSRLDFHQASAELDNLLNIATSFETHEELGQRLLAECMMLEEPNRVLMSERAFEQLRLAIPEDTIQKIVVKDNLEATFGNIIAMCQRGDNNPVYELLYSGNAMWGIDHFSKIKIETEGKSDMLRETYTTEDPGICKRTLELHIEIYSRKQKDIKRAQSKDVVEYFRRQLAETEKKLRAAEDALTAYMKKNKVINYYEQTRFIAAKREDLYELEFKEFMKLQSADSTIMRLEQEMERRVNLGVLNKELGSLRDSLAKVSVEIARVEWLGQDTTSGPRLSWLKETSERLKGKIMLSGDSISQVQVTPRGTDIKSLLFQWLRNVMLKEEAEAKLSVVGIRKDEFDAIFRKYAPVGSEIKRLERVNYVHEQSYLENLHSLNMAIMHQQNMLLSSSLNMISNPFFPSRPDPSSRKFLIVAAFLAGFVLTLALIVALEYFDRTLKTPENAELVTGLEVIGALPRFIQPKKKKKGKEGGDDKGKKKKKKKGIDYEYLKERSIGLLLQNLKIELKKRGITDRPIKLLIVSMDGREGKSFLSDLLASQLRTYNEQVLLLAPESLEEEEEEEDDKKKKKKKEEAPPPPVIREHENTHFYHVPPWFYDMKSEQDLLSDQEVKVGEFDTLITELPALLLHPYPFHIIGKADMVLLIARANRVWGDVDANTLDRIQQGTEQDIRMVLNGTRVEAMETIMGNLPKNRSAIRKLVKKVLTLSFKAKSGI